MAGATWQIYLLDVLFFHHEQCVLSPSALDPHGLMLFVGAADGSGSDTSSSNDLTDSETVSESGSESDDDLEMHQVSPLPYLSSLHTLQVCPSWLCCELTGFIQNISALHCPWGCLLHAEQGLSLAACATSACAGQQHFPVCCPLAAAAPCQDGPSPHWGPQPEIVLHPSTAQAVARSLCQSWSQPSIRPQSTTPLRSRATAHVVRNPHCLMRPI